MIVQNAINNRWDIPCYSFIAIDPRHVGAFFRRIAYFVKAALAGRKANAHGLSNAMAAKPQL